MINYIEYYWEVCFKAPQYSADKKQTFCASLDILCLI